RAEPVLLKGCHCIPFGLAPAALEMLRNHQRNHAHAPTQVLRKGGRIARTRRNIFVAETDHVRIEKLVQLFLEGSGELNPDMRPCGPRDDNIGAFIPLRRSLVADEASKGICHGESPRHPDCTRPDICDAQPWDVKAGSAGTWQARELDVSDASARVFRHPQPVRRNTPKRVRQSVIDRGIVQRALAIPPYSTVQPIAARIDFKSTTKDIPIANSVANTIMRNRSPGICWRMRLPT